MLAVGELAFFEKEGLRADVYLASGSIVSIRLQKITNKVLRIITNILPVSLMENDSGIAAFIDEILEILASERRISAEESVGNDSKGPHVYWLSMTLLQHDLWGCVSK